VIKTAFSAVAVLVVFPLAVAGCSRQPAPVATAQPAAGQASPAAVPAADGVPATQGVETVTGDVLETMDASNYTYMRIKTAKGEIWAATGQTIVAVGEKVTVPLESEMRNFHSPSLNRDFPLIYFVTQISKGGESIPQMAVGHGMGAGSASAGPVTVKPMAPPAGGSSIADVWAKRASLAGKPVTINGTVVKFNGGILGRNWLHVQDGSGKADDGTNDITVTTDAMAKVGDVVTVTGKIAVDKDFGSGYAYKVMVEDGKVK
jgi:hypothetical protein